MLSYSDPEYLVQFFTNFDSIVFVNRGTNTYFVIHRSQFSTDEQTTTPFRLPRFQTLTTRLANGEPDDESEATAETPPTAADGVQLASASPTDEVTTTPATPDTNQATVFLQTTKVGAEFSLQLDRLPPVEKQKTVQELQRIVERHGVNSAEAVSFVAAQTKLITEKKTSTAIRPIRLGKLQFSRPIAAVTPAVYDNVKVPTLGSGARRSTLKGFNQSYARELLEKDINTVFNAFAQKKESSLKIVGPIERVDSSDALNRKDTWRVNYVDEKGSKHTVSIDVPRVFDGNRIHIGGSTKAIGKQLVRLPVVKTRYNTVEITTNSGNKVTLTVPESGVLDHEFKTLKSLIKDGLLPSKIYTRGNVLGENKGLVVPIDYYHLSGFLASITASGNTFVFSQPKLEEALRERFGIESLEKQIVKDWGEDSRERMVIVGYTETQLVYYDISHSMTFRKKFDSSELDTPVNGINTISAEIYRLLAAEGAIPAGTKLAAGRKLAHTLVTVAKKNIPLAALICVRDGLEAIFTKSAIEYRFFKDAQPDAEYDHTIDLADGVLAWNDKNIRSSLITNGLVSIDFSTMTWEQANEPPASYVQHFTDQYGSPMLLRGALNILAALIDPITNEILIDLGLPTDVVDLMIYASNLLDNAYFLAINDVRNFRLRGTEIIAAVLAMTLSKAYSTMLLSNRQGRVTKLSVKPNELITRLLQDRLVSDISVLNPVLETEEYMGKVTYKGIGGINMDHAFNSNYGEPRYYHETMLGKIALASPDSSGVGIIKHLTADMAVDNLRGYLGGSPPANKLNAFNMLSVSELLSPFTNRHSDPPRSAIKNLCRLAA